MLVCVHNVHCYPGIPSLLKDIFLANKVRSFREREREREFLANKVRSFRERERERDTVRLLYFAWANHRHRQCCIQHTEEFFIGAVMTGFARTFTFIKAVYTIANLKCVP